jgi:hypothetical protein
MGGADGAAAEPNSSMVASIVAMVRIGIEFKMIVFVSCVGA